jgi:amino acid adenylation domain-containing protein
VFELGSAPLIRVHAHQTADDRWYLSLTECHAILDGWSHNSIISELLAGYRAVRDHRPPPHTAQRTVRYADFVAQERHSLASPADREFWTGRLGVANRLEIPAAWADPDGPPMYSVVVPFDDIEAGLRALAAHAGGSLKSVLLSAHIAVWRTIAGTEAFYSGLLCNGRTEVAGGDQVRGMFLNPVPFVAPAGATTWRELVRAVFAEEVELWPHRRFPLPEMQREFGGGRRLLDVAFNYLDFHVLDREMVDTSGSTDVSPNEFPLAVLTHRGRLVIAAKSRWVGRRYAELLAEMYRRALTMMAADPDASTRVSLIPPAERTRLLTEGNRGWESRPPDRGIHELVAERAARAPDAVAVESAVGWLTYRELHGRACAWAVQLRRAGVRPGDLVGVCLPRGPDLVAGMLGIITIGAAYVPIDPRHPAGRIAVLLRDAGVRAVLAGTDLADRLPTGPPTVVPGQLYVVIWGNARVAEPPRRDGAADGADVAVHRPHRDELVYVIHTSGSTGRPKGVMVRHGALVDRLWSMRRNVSLTDDDVVVVVVPMVTDVYQLGTFAALASGGRLVLAEEDLARDPLSLADLLRGCGATFMQASPTTWRMLTESGWVPKAGFRLLSGGEAMGTGLMRRLCATDAEVWDMYGPTEATVWCFGTGYHGGATPPTWVSAANTTTYLLDGELEPVPFGVPGQIFVGGDGLARGYLGEPGTTAGVFVPDPYASTPGGRIYATGDIGRRDRDGRIEILGRSDDQVKIRGFRVELGEIENTLAAHPGVRAAVARAVPGPQLAAYVIVHDDSTTVAELRRFVSDALPGYMVPNHFVALESFPRLPNGKVDRTALPVPGPGRPESATPYVPPRGPTEEAIADVLADVLGIDRVGRDDDYFALGGHSLLTLQIVARLPREHGIDLTFRDFLEHRTVRGLATAATPGGTSRARPSALLWLNGRTEGTPLFCVHPGGGSAHWYRDLADVYTPERPLAAFEWPGLHGDYRAAASVMEIAMMYLAELRSVRPAGPYHILGWCASSGIAWEMARHLYAAGERARLILIDPIEYASARVNPLLANLKVLRRAEMLSESLRNEPRGPRQQDVRAELVAVLRGVVDDGDVGIGEEDLDLGGAWAHRLRAWREMAEVRSRYRFSTYPGVVELVVCQELAADRYEDILGQRFDDYIGQWRRLASGGVRIHSVPGDHRTALFPPHVSTLAATLSTIIDDTDNAED